MEKFSINDCKVVKCSELLKEIKEDSKRYRNGTCR